MLTIVSTLPLPASVILGFFGTSNLQNAPFLTSAGGFVLMVASILVVSMGTLYVFRSKGWL